MAIHNTSVAQIQIIRIKNCIKTSAFKRSPSQWINCASNSKAVSAKKLQNRRRYRVTAEHLTAQA